MFIDSQVWTQFMIMVGEITFFLILGMILSAALLAIVVVYSIEKGQFYFPRLLKSGLVLMEGLIKAICKLFRLDDKELTTFFIKLHNTMNLRAFTAVPVDRRSIFLPQCLRSARCPAHLSPEGLKCKRCGLCQIGQMIDIMEGMGYGVYIVPGSSFIKRLIKKDHPEAIVGVGCLMEVKEGIEMADRMGLLAMGVVTLKDGCVETVVNWNDVFDIAALGTNRPLVPENFEISSV